LKTSFTRYALIILPWLFHYSLAVCQEFPFQHYSRQHGLASDDITALLQDDRGFLWVRTNRGLHRFDGRDFNVFLSSRNSDSSLSNNETLSIMEDRNGDLWIGTRDGLNRFNPQKGTFEVYWVDDHENELYVHDIFEDQWGNVYFGTYSGLFRISEDKTIQSVPLKDRDSDENGNVVWKILEDDGGDLWVGTNTRIHILHRKINGKITRETVLKREKGDPNSLSGNRIWGLAKDADGNIWTAGNNGVCRSVADEGTGIRFERFTMAREIRTTFKVGIWRVFILIDSTCCGSPRPKGYTWQI